MNIKKLEVTKEPNNTYKVDVVIDKETVNEFWNEAISHEGSHMEIKGFRKGKAPLNVVKENLDASKLRSHALNHMLPDLYKRILDENKIHPIINPRFDIKKFDENEDLEMLVILVERPEIKIGDYKKNLKKKYSDKQKNKKEDESADLTNEEIIEAVADASVVELSNVLIEEETDRMMENMLQQIDRMGITLEKYIEATGKSAEDIRKEYLEISKKSLTGDFALTEIAVTNGYDVTDEEIEQTIAAVPDQKSREELAKPEQKYYIKAILVKGKTISKLSEIAKEGDNKSEKPSTNKSSSKKEEK